MKRLIMIVMALAAVSCVKKKKEDNALAGAPFLTARDFEVPSDVTQESKNAMESHFAYGPRYEFYANYPKSESKASAPSKEQDARTKCLESKYNFVVHASGNKLGYSGEVDLTGCPEDENSSGRFKTETLSSRIKYFMEFGCDGADFSKYNGKTISELVKELDNKDPCPNRTLTTTLTNMRVLSTVRYTVTSQPSYEVDSEITSAQAAPDGKACEEKVANGTIVHGPCIDIDLYRTTQKGGGKDSSSTSFTRAEKVDIVANDDKTSPFFRSGIIKYVHNNWSGQVKYSDANTPPTFTMTGGKDTITGSLGQRSSFRIAGDELAASDPVALANRRLLSELLESLPQFK